MRLVHRGEYPEHWPLLSAAVKKAAGHRCIRCGHPAGDRFVTGPIPRRYIAPCLVGCSHPFDGKMRALTVHHIDGDKGNDHWWNLAALCQVCHLQVQAKLIPERPYLWEHTEWFKPYVAGYYAAQVGIFLSRAEIEAALDHFLALGQPWLAEAQA